MPPPVPSALRAVKMCVRAWALLCMLLPLAGVADASEAARAAEPAERMVSINPSLTAIVLAIGGGDQLVGIDDYSARQQPTLASLPRVGGLYNPSLEAVLALRPDRVVLVPSVEQRDFRRRLEALGVPVSVFENLRFEQVIANIEDLGRLLGRRTAAAERIDAIRSARNEIARALRGSQSGSERSGAEHSGPRTLLVLQRDPVFVAGAGSFLDEMLRAAGGRNLGAAFEDAYPRVAIEWILAQAPEVLIDMSPEPEADDAHAYWSRWPSLPAVDSKRVLRLDQSVTLPGPYLDRSLWTLARALHGNDFAEREGSGESASGASP